MRRTGITRVAMSAAVIMFTACGGDAGDQPGTPSGGTGAPQQPVGTNVQLPEGVTLAMVQDGKTVFETTTCFTCHGMDGSGSALAPSLRDQNWLNSDGSYDGIVGVVRSGVDQPKEYPTAMPPMGGAPLSDEQVRAVAAYVYAISHGG